MRADNVPSDIFEQLLNFKPHYVFLQLGGNDIQIGKDAQKITDDSETLTSRLLNSGCKERVYRRNTV